MQLRMGGSCESMFSTARCTVATWLVKTKVAVSAAGVRTRRNPSLRTTAPSTTPATAGSVPLRVSSRSQRKASLLPDLRSADNKMRLATITITTTTAQTARCRTSFCALKHSYQTIKTSVREISGGNKI